MIQISPSASASKPSSARPALPASGGTQAFAGALKKALAPETGTAAEAEGETRAAEHAVRQKTAGDGKELPDSPESETDDSDDNDKSADVAFAWFGASLVLPQPVAAPALPTLAVGAKGIQLPGGQLPTGGATPQPAIAQLPADPATAAQPATQDMGEAELKLSAALAAPATGTEAKPPVTPAATADAQAAPEKTAGPIRIELPTAPEAPKHVAPITTLASIQPRAEAVHAAAASLAPSTVEGPSPRRQTSRESTISQIATLAAEAPRTHAVAAAGDTQQPALNLQTREGAQAMIDRIDALRDSSGSKETSIRLSPDALGTVSISIRQEGDRVHVRFTAENDAARAALADAQPRLAELAEARGLRLGQTSVDGGSAGQSQGYNQGQRQDAAPRTAFTTAPASAPGGETATDADERVA